MSGPACREIRQLLGVYVVGAIDPAERSIVDAHLHGAADCREELSGLAGLPALLGRVPLADAERLTAAGPGLPDMAEPPAELLNGLLRRVAARRRARRWRSVLALAAAVAIAAGGTAAWSTRCSRGHPRPRRRSRAATPASRRQIRYSSTSVGRHRDARRGHGHPAGHALHVLCRRLRADSARSGRHLDDRPELRRALVLDPGPDVPESNVQGFQITAHGKPLLSVNA